MAQPNTNAQVSADDTEELTAEAAGDVDEKHTADFEPVGVKCVLLDIEGTICPITFVKETLFPYALKALPGVLATKWDDEDFRPYRDAFPEEHRSSPASLQAYVERLTKEDRKDACHKNLQGYLWETGYTTGAYATPLFPDVAPRLKQWKDAGLTLAIYSSGSVFAQKLLFGHVQAQPPPFTGDGKAYGREHDTDMGAIPPPVGLKRSIDEVSGPSSVEAATEQPPTKKIVASVDGVDAAESVPKQDVATEDLQYLISDWYDTMNAGPKKEASSYTNIAEALELEPADILFLTDSVEEYDASTAAGCKAGLMMRPGNPPVSRLRKPDERPKMMRSLHNANPLRENYGINDPAKEDRKPPLLPKRE